MNVCLNGSLAQMPAIHFDVLLTQKKKDALSLAFRYLNHLSKTAVWKVFHIFKREEDFNTFRK